LPDWACDTPFTDLFDGSDLTFVTPEKVSVLADGGAQVFSQNDWPNKIWLRSAAGFTSCEAFVAESIRQAHSLRPLCHIEDAAKRFVFERQVEAAFGLHVRYTDNLTGHAHKAHFRPDDVSRLDGFRRFIGDQLHVNAAQTFFLATDNEDVERVLLNEFGSSVLFYRKLWRDDGAWWSRERGHTSDSEKARASSVADALIELEILSKCRVVVGSYFSSYSRFAAIRGGRDLILVRGEAYEPPISRLLQCPPRYGLANVARLSADDLTWGR
jgi:hypothetical protein